VIVLSNEGNVGLPDALAMWALDRLMGNPVVDHVADALKGAKEQFASFDKLFARPASPRPFPPLAPLAGRVTSPSFGKGMLRGEGDALVLALEETGAELALMPWDGDVFTFRVLPRGRFAPMVATNAGPRVSGFAQFEIGQDGKLRVLYLRMVDGQAYDFRRD